MGFGEQDHRGKMPSLLHLVKGTYCQYDLSLYVNFDHMVEIVFIWFLQITLFLSLKILEYFFFSCDSLYL